MNNQTGELIELIAKIEALTDAARRALDMLISLMELCPDDLAWRQPDTLQHLFDSLQSSFSVN